MKKTLSTLLVVTLVISCLFALSGCSMIQDPMASEDTRLHSDGCLSFEYPMNWIKMPFGVDMVMDTEGTGNNINVSYEAKNDLYDDIDIEKFNEVLKPAFEEAGLVVSNATVEKGTTNGLDYILLSYDSVMGGSNMHQTQVITTVGERTYILTITEMVADPDLVETVISTLSAK